jgi:signal transduction histidine kinase
MRFPIDLYGQRSLEVRFVFYLTVLVLIMTAFSASILTTEAYRGFLEEAAGRSRATADRVAASLAAAGSTRSAGRPGAPEGRAGASGAGPAPPAPREAGLSAVGIRTRDGFATIEGEDVSRFQVPRDPDLQALAVSETGGRGRTAWAFLERGRGMELVVLLDAAPAYGHLRRLVVTLAWITALTLVIHAFLALVMARNVLRPLREMAEGIGKATQGKFTFAMTVAEQDEVGQLKAAFNYMQRQLKENEMMQRQLLHHEHLATVGRLAASVAHEVRNPLASISTLTQMIASDPGASAKTQEYSAVIRREIQRMDSSIQELLGFARPSPPSFAPGRLSRVVEDVVGLMAPESRRRQLDLAFANGWSDESPLLMDAGKLKQLLVNLVKNAMEAIGSGGRIALGLAYDAETDHAILTVEDDGPGLPEDLKGAMFEAFTSTKPGGTGLGLAIAARMVALHNGRISVDTELERGTRITVRLPRLNPEEAARLAGSAGGAPDRLAPPGGESGTSST